MARWCLAYCQEHDARDARTAAAVAPLTTRLDMDAGPPRGIQHQVRKLLRKYWYKSVQQKVFQKDLKSSLYERVKYLYPLPRSAPHHALNVMGSVGMGDCCMGWVGRGVLGAGESSCQADAAPGKSHLIYQNTRYSLELTSHYACSIACTGCHQCACCSPG